jgi:hypothetical protein
VQAVMLGLGGLAGVKGLAKATDVGAGMMEAGAKGAQEGAHAALDFQVPEWAQGKTGAIPYLESPKGAELLGTTAAHNGLPATASPYPPDSPLAAAWQQGHASTTAPEAAPITPQSEPASGTLAPVEGTGPTKTRGLSAGVEAKAVENKLAISLGDLPEYRSISMADQAAQSTDLLARDPALARRVALGEVPAPHGLLPESVFIAVENKALAEGDVATIRDLASGGLTEQATTMGQRIRALGERDPESPVAAIQKIADARERTAGDIPKATAKVMADIQRQVNKANGSRAELLDTLAKFVDAMRC